VNDPRLADAARSRVSLGSFRFNFFSFAVLVVGACGSIQTHHRWGREATLQAATARVRGSSGSGARATALRFFRDTPAA
jgi:hypothetical protein